MDKKKIKLSKTQVELLRAMREGAEIHYQRYMGTFADRQFWRVDTFKPVTAAADALVNKGLAKIHEANLILTDAGKAWKDGDA